MPDYDLAQHGVRLMVGDPVAQAYEWVRKYAKHLVVSPEELIQSGTLNAFDFGPSEGNRLKVSGHLHVIRVDPEFWDKLEILLDAEIEHRRRKNFFY